MAIVTRCPDPARHRKAVIFACDEGYARYASFAAAQIAALHPDRDFDLCLCSLEEVEANPALAGLGLRLCRIEVGGIFDGLRFDARRSQIAYLRIALPQAFSGEYDRILYLDSDTFVQGGDFSALLDLPLGPCGVAAVRDNTQWRTPGRYPPEFRALGLGNAAYFNSGCLLFDVAACVADDLLGACLAFGGRHAADLVRHDQTLLNCVLHGRWAELSPVWNWQYTWASRLFEAMEGAHVIHFIGPKKPWSHTGGELPPRFRRAYAAFMADVWPGQPQIDPAGLAPHANRRFLRRSFAKHWLATPKMCAYLDRFESDLSVAG